LFEKTYNDLIDGMNKMAPIEAAFSNLGFCFNGGLFCISTWGIGWVYL
jgi:hypothetical protein